MVKALKLRVLAPEIVSMAPLRTRIFPFVAPKLPLVHAKVPSTIIVPFPLTTPGDASATVPRAFTIIVSARVSVLAICSACAPVAPPNSTRPAVAGTFSVTVYVPP